MEGLEAKPPQRQISVTAFGSPWVTGPGGLAGNKREGPRGLYFFSRMTSSTRLFLARPSFVLLSPIGFAGP